MATRERRESLSPALPGDGRGAGRGRRGTLLVEHDLQRHGPRRVSEVLDASVEILRARFPVLVLSAAAIWLPSRLLHEYLTLPAQSAALEEPGFAGLGAFYLFVIVESLVSMLAQYLVAAPVTVLAFGALRGERVPMGAAWRASLPRFPMLVAVGVFSAIAVFAGASCCIVPGIFLAWRLLFVAPACVLERSGFSQSLHRSWVLSGGLLGPALAVLAFGTAIVTLFSLPTGAFDLPEARDALLESLPFASQAAASVVLALAASLFLGLADALRAIVTAVLYASARARHDGDDLAARLDAAFPPAGAAPPAWERA